MNRFNNCFGDCGRYDRGPYITAYQIAIKHGFKGTEAEWINSIGQWRVIRATQGSGNAFECDTLLSDVFAALEHGIVPVMIFGDRVLAFPTEGGDDYIGFGTLMYRDGGTDKYDVYTMSRRGNTVQTRTVSGGEGGEGWAPGNNSIEYMWLEESVRGSLDKAESAVQPEDLFTIKGYATMSSYQADRGNVRVGDFVLITETGGSNLYRRVETQAATDPELALVYTFAGGSGADVINLANNGIGYAVSPQQLDTTARTAALEGYQLRYNGLVAVRFGSAVEGPNPTLNINNTYAVPMYHNGAALTGGEIRAGATALFVFDGNNYNLLCVDSANRNYGTQNAGKPLVVGSDGTETVGNWPVPGESGEPVTWADIVPPAGILQTDIAKLTVEFTENLQGGYDASSNLTAVMAALAANKIVDCSMGDYHGELIYAHADSEDTSAEFAIFKITEQIETYQGLDGEERLPQVRMFYMTHVGVTYQVNAIGGACYVFVTENQGVYDVDTVNTSKTAQSIQGLLTAFYAGIETRMIVYNGYYRWSHPVSFHYGQAEIRFAGPEAVTVNGRTEIRMVEYTINASTHVGRTVGSTLPVPASGEPLNPSADKGKIPEVDEYGRFVLVTPADDIVPTPSAQQVGYILVANAQGGFTLTLPEAASGADGISPALKNALSNLAHGIGAYNTQNGPALVAALDAALFPTEPEPELVSISAVYTQGSTEVTPNTPLSDLKANLVVTATYDDSSTETITTYQLSGTLAVGTSAVTVTYEGLTTTFNVTVTAALEIVSISAVFAPGSTRVHDGDALDTLKPMLTVTATYDDQSTGTLAAADYSLSGSLVYGQRTITVTAGNASDTFSVNVGNPRLPTGYHEAEYIEMDGQAYVTLQHAIPLGYKVITTATQESIGEATKVACGGTNVDAYIAYFGYSAATANRVMAYYGAIGTAGVEMDELYGLETTAETTITADEILFKVTNSSGEKTVTQALSGAAAQANMFRVGHSNTTTSMFVGTVKRIVVLNTTQQRDSFLFPAVRDSDDAAGFYDAVSGLFHVSETSTPFTAGPLV